MSALTSLSIQLPQSSQITVSSPPTAGVWTRAASAVLQGDGSGEALLLGRRMVPNRAHPLPPFAVISTRLGANITISCEEGTPLVSLGSHGSSSGQHFDRAEETKGTAVVVSCVYTIDSGLTAIYNTLAVSRRNHRSALAKAIVDAREGIGRGMGIANEKPSESMSVGILSNARAAPPPVALVVGVKGSGRTTLVRQLGNLFYEEDTLASGGGGGGTEEGGILAVVSGDVTSGGSSGTSLPGALSCDFITNEPVQPLTYFCGSTCVDAPKASNRYLDIATYMAQGLEVLQLEAVGKAANAHSAAMASEKQSGTSVDKAATLDLSKCLAAVLVDTVGLPSSSSSPSSLFSFSESSKEFGLVREMSDIFKATHVISVGRSFEEAALLASKLKASVAAFRKVEILTYVPNHSTNTVVAVVGDAFTPQHQLCMRVHRPIAEYFSGSLHRPLAPHLQVFAVNELIFLDAVTFTVVSPPTAALQGTLAAVPFRAPIEHIDAASVCGFVIIKEIGAEYVSLLCPSRGRLPSSVLLVTSIPAPPSLMVSVTF